MPEGIIISKDDSEFIFNKYKLKLVEKGQIGLIKFLIQNGVDVKSMDGHDLSFIAKTGNMEMMKWLVEHGAPVKEMTGWMFLIAEAGNVEMLKLLLEHGANLKTFNSFDLYIIAK